MERLSIQQDLRRAKMAGADRIYGWFVRGGGTETYYLKAVDSAGKTYVRRGMAWPVYLAAVIFWQDLRQSASPAEASPAEEPFFEQLKVAL